MQEILSGDKDTQELVDLTYDSRELGRTVKNILKEQKNEEARREKEEKKRQSRVSERCGACDVAAWRRNVPQPASGRRWQAAAGERARAGGGGCIGKHRVLAVQPLMIVLFIVLSRNKLRSQ
jgi:hypothetical protein